MAFLVKGTDIVGATYPTSIETLQDVDIGTKTNGQVLMYDSTTSKWKNKDLSTISDTTINNIINQIYS